MYIARPLIPGRMRLTEDSEDGTQLCRKLAGSFTYPLTHFYRLIRNKLAWLQPVKATGDSGVLFFPRTD